MSVAFFKDCWSYFFYYRIQVEMAKYIHLKIFALGYPNSRALPDITSSPEVRQIFKIRTVRKPDVFLPGRRTFKTFKNRKKNPKTFFLKNIFSNFFFKFFCLLIWSRNFWHQICVQGPYLMRIDNLYLVGKMFKNISPDSVRSGRTCPANLGVLSGNSYAQLGWALPKSKKFHNKWMFFAILTWMQ